MTSVNIKMELSYAKLLADVRRQVVSLERRRLYYDYLARVLRVYKVYSDRRVKVENRDAWGRVYYTSQVVTDVTTVTETHSYDMDDDGYIVKVGYKLTKVKAESLRRQCRNTQNNLWGVVVAANKSYGIELLRMSLLMAMAVKLEAETRGQPDAIILNYGDFCFVGVVLSALVPASVKLRGQKVDASVADIFLRTLALEKAEALIADFRVRFPEKKRPKADIMYQDVCAYFRKLINEEGRENKELTASDIMMAAMAIPQTIKGNLPNKKNVMLLSTAVANPYCRALRRKVLFGLQLIFEHLAQRAFVGMTVQGATSKHPFKNKMKAIASQQRAALTNFAKTFSVATWVSGGKQLNEICMRVRPWHNIADDGSLRIVGNVIWLRRVFLAAGEWEDEKLVREVKLMQYNCVRPLADMLGDAAPKEPLQVQVNGRWYLFDGMAWMVCYQDIWVDLNPQLETPATISALIAFAKSKGYSPEGMFQLRIVSFTTKEVNVGFFSRGSTFSAMQKDLAVASFNLMARKPRNLPEELPKFRAHLVKKGAQYLWPSDERMAAMVQFCQSNAPSAAFCGQGHPTLAPSEYKALLMLHPELKVRADELAYETFAISMRQGGMTKPSLEPAFFLPEETSYINCILANRQNMLEPARLAMELAQATVTLNDANAAVDYWNRFVVDKLDDYETCFGRDKLMVARQFFNQKAEPERRRYLMALTDYQTRAQQAAIQQTINQQLQM